MRRWRKRRTTYSRHSLPGYHRRTERVKAPALLDIQDVPQHPTNKASAQGHRVDLFRVRRPESDPQRLATSFLRPPRNPSIPYLDPLPSSSPTASSASGISRLMIPVPLSPLIVVRVGHAPTISRDELGIADVVPFVQRSGQVACGLRWAGTFPFARFGRGGVALRL